MFQLPPCLHRLFGGILIELLSANLGAGDPRLRSEPPEKVPEGEPTTCVFVFFALNLAMFDGLDFPAVRSRKSGCSLPRKEDARSSHEALVLPAQRKRRLGDAGAPPCEPLRDRWRRRWRGAPPRAPSRRSRSAH